MRAALESDQSCVRELASRYAVRRGIVAGGLRDAGLDVFDSDGGIYAWVRAPKGLTGEQFADCTVGTGGRRRFAGHMLR